MSKRSMPIAFSRKMIIFFIAVVMIFSMVLIIRDAVAAAPGDMWDLSNFVTSVTMQDPSTTPPTTVNPGDTTYLGQNYIFTINFAETPTLQLAYTQNNAPYTDGMLVFQLPPQLTVPNAIPQSPIYFGNGTVRVGSYTISATGLVYVWFDNVNNSGAPTPGNFIDNYTNVQFRLQITAQLVDGGGGSLDFGNITVNVTPPVPPPPKLTVAKSSQYNATLERISYMITITAENEPISNIVLDDAPTINLGSGNVPINNPTANNAFYGFRYALNGSTNFIPMSVAWPAVNPAIFTYDFGADGIVLNPGDFITVYYYVDIQTLCANNGIDPLVYNFNINNNVAVNADNVDPVTGNTSDHVVKTFPISKSGVYTAGTPGYITWTITIGDSSAASSTHLNGGTITDTLGSGMWLPADLSTIEIFMYYQGNTLGTADADETTDAADPELDLVLSTNPNPPAGPPYNQFVFTVPPDATYGPIYRIQIVYETPLSNPPENRPGFPPTVYENSISFDDQGTVGRVPFTPPKIPITKITSGICGSPSGGYWIDYTIDVTIPAGLYGQTFYIYDTLGRLPGNSGVTNNPTLNTVNPFTVTGMPTGIETSIPFQYAGPITSGNMWRIYPGTATAPPAGTNLWPYRNPVDITITYRIDLNAQTVADLSANKSTVQNTTYLINSSIYPPILSGSNQNSVGGISVNDSWPIFKAGTPTDANPSLFNYTVTLNGAYSSRPNSLFQSGTPANPTNPVFSEIFDPRMTYVPGTFYIWDTVTNRFYAPNTGSDVTSTGANSFSINLNTLWQYTSPPAPTGSGTQGGTPIGSAPASPAWYTGRNNFEVHYQLMLKPEYLASNQPTLTNTASIAVAPGQCTFNNGFSENYNPPPIGKTVTTDGSDIVHVEIIINPDGGFLFSDGTNPAPGTITARDELTNLMVYLDGITVYTEPMVSGHWGGIWIPQPITYNDRALWSVNVVSPDIIEFVLPNQQPVKIVYDALVTLPQGTQGTVSNKMSILGTVGEDGQDNYQVSDTTAGATADALNLRLFKQCPVNNIFLPGATFTLYIANLEAPGVPPYGITAPAVNLGGISFYPLVADVVTDTFGIAQFVNPGINTTFEFLFMLYETLPPPGYTPGGQNPNPFESYTFFTIKPDIDTTLLSGAQSALDAASAPGTGVVINQISDFITVNNTPQPGTAGSLRIWKLFSGLDMTDPQILQQLQNFQIVITDMMAVDHIFNLSQAMDPFGITLENLTSGTFFIRENNAEVSGYYIPVTNPPLPIRENINISSTGEVLIQINNIYTPHPAQQPNSLVVQKLFNFPPGTTATEVRRCMQSLLSQGFMLNITGPGGFDEKIGLLDALQGVTFNNIQEGTYFFSEVNANLAGYDLAFTNFRSYIMPNDTGSVTIQVNNNYTIPGMAVPPGHPESLYIQKSFNFPQGTSDAQIQQYMRTLDNQGFKIVVDGPGNFHEELNLSEVLAGVTYLNVQEGSYTFREVNAGLPGLRLSTTPPLPNTINVIPNVINAVTMLINNSYTTPPPDVIASPKTGVDRNILTPLIMLTFSGVCFAGADFYRRRLK